MEYNAMHTCIIFLFLLRVEEISLFHLFFITLHSWTCWIVFIHFMDLFIPFWVLNLTCFTVPQFISKAGSSTFIMSYTSFLSSLQGGRGDASPAQHWGPPDGFFPSRIHLCPPLLLQKEETFPFILQRLQGTGKLLWCLAEFIYRNCTTAWWTLPKLLHSGRTTGLWVVCLAASYLLFIIY